MPRYSGWKQNQIKGLDLMLDKHIGYKTDGFFVEVGGFDCCQWSPCYPLAVLGWSGIYFEPQPDLFYKCVRTHENRENVTIVKKAISNFCGATTMYISGSISTISRESRDLYMDIPEFQSSGHGNGITELVDVSTLDIELDRLCAPIGFDVLSVDVEGEEINVLSCFNIGRWSPKMVIIESHEKFWDERLSAKSRPINDYMMSAGYKKIYCDHINNIYIR